MSMPSRTLRVTHGPSTRRTTVRREQYTIRRPRSFTGLRLACSVLAAVPLLFGAPAWAETATFTPVADSYVASDQPDANFGTAAALRISAGDPTKRAYLQFDVALPEGAEIVGATLNVDTTVSMSTRGFNAYEVPDDSWDESTITYGNAPPFGAQIASSGPWSLPGYRSLTLPATAVSIGLNSFGLGNESSYYKRFSSREAVDEPQLVIDYTIDPVVAAAGDIACDPASTNYNGGDGTASSCRQRSTSDLLLDRDLAAVLPLGDEQYQRGTLPAFSASFGPTWGRSKALMRPVPGNHEYETAGAEGYFDYFNGVGASSGVAGDRDKGYYSYDVGAWHLIALNSNCSDVGGCEAGSPQQQWLQSDLAQHATVCTLAYWHHARFSSGLHGNADAMQAIWQTLQDAGADVVLSGHDHDYERFAPQTATGVADPTAGLREFVVGTGGRDHYAFDTVEQPNSEARSSDTFGVLMLTLHPTSYDWQFVPESGMTFTDTGSADCH
jgi:hypothetical protein